MACIPSVAPLPPLPGRLRQQKTSHFPTRHLTPRRHRLLPLSSTPSPNSDPSLYPEGFEVAPDPYETQPPTYKIEKRQKAALLRESRTGTAIQKPEPPNFEIGWKRTKEISHEKPKGWVIADFLEKLESLMGRQFGSADLLAKTGGIVAERAREEVEVLVDGGEVDERMATELFRVLKLMEMDLEMVRAAVKEETRNERIEQAKARCRQAILVALSL